MASIFLLSRKIVLLALLALLSLAFLGMPTLGQPESYIGNSGSLFEEGGELTNDGTRDFLTAFGKAFAAWIDKQAA